MDLLTTQEEEQETIDDRVFVCYGQAADGIEKKVWVMTINDTYEDVTFWDVKQHKHFILKGRIQKAEKKFLKSFLTPVISKDERE